MSKIFNGSRSRCCCIKIKVTSTRNDKFSEMDDCSKVALSKETVIAEDDDIKDYPANRINKLKQRRLWITAILFYAAFSYGLWLAYLGASVVELQQLMNTSTQQISTVFTWRSVGVLIGCMIVAPVFSRLNQFLAMGTCYFILGSSQMVLANCTNLTHFSIIIGLQGACGGFVSAGQAGIILDLWQEQGASFTQALFVVTILGSSVSPQIIKPFLQKDSLFHRQTNGNSTYSKATKVFENLTHTNETETIKSDESNLKYGIMIIGLFLLLSSVIYWINFFTSGCSFRNIDFVKKSKDKTTKIQHTPLNQPRALNAVIIIQLGFMSVISGALQEKMGSFTAEYTVNGLDWDKSAGAVIATLYWVSDCISRLVASFLSTKFQSKNLLGCYVLVILLSSILTISTFQYISTTVWIFVTGIGLGTGSMSGFILFLSTLVYSSGPIASIVFHVEIYFAKILLPVVMGYLFQNVSYSWFCYMSFILSVVLLLVYTSLRVSLYFYQRNITRNNQKV